MGLGMIKNAIAVVNFGCEFFMKAWIKVSAAEKESDGRREALDGKKTYDVTKMHVDDEQERTKHQTLGYCWIKERWRRCSC